jgi:prepilin-type N-terminal cleavage/methylation domain-containing protein
MDQLLIDIGVNFMALKSLRKDSKSGFTLIELLVVIAIIAILSISSFLTTYYRYQNVSQNDAPPEPRVFRGVNREEPTESNI